MLLLVVGLTWCTTSVSGYIPASNVFYQHTIIPNACIYGNLTVGALGTNYMPKDCNSQINNKVLQHAPFIFVNSTNSTERFTIVMVDMGAKGPGHGTYLQWMITNTTMNMTNYRIPPNNILAGYQQPLLMHAAPQPTLIQILVFRHHNVLRVPFGELWVTQRKNFSLSTLFSNTAPNLRLCGPVAATQFWVYDDSLIPSAPQIPQHVPAVLVPMVPVQPQPGYPLHPGQAGYVPSTQQQHPHAPVHKKSLGSVTQPMNILFVPLVICTIMFL